LKRVCRLIAASNDSEMLKGMEMLSEKLGNTLIRDNQIDCLQILASLTMSAGGIVEYCRLGNIMIEMTKALTY
jgi:hypothetical protein